jgi:hypothetical protein
MAWIKLRSPLRKLKLRIRHPGTALFVYKRRGARTGPSSEVRLKCRFESPSGSCLAQAPSSSKTFERQKGRFEVKSSCKSKIAGFFLCKEQQHGQKQDVLVVRVWLRTFGFWSRLVWLCIYFTFFSLFCSLQLPIWNFQVALCLWGFSAVSELSPDFLSERDQVKSSY